MTFPVDCRIVGYDEFVRLPPGTVFSSWVPCIVGQMMVKGETLNSRDGEPIDFYESQVTADIYLGSNGVDYDRVVVDDIGGRWGEFDTQAQFIVYPPEAVRAVIHRLQESLGTLGAEAPPLGLDAVQIQYVVAKHGLCPACLGTGDLDATYRAPCRECRGSGRAQ